MKKWLIGLGLAVVLVIAGVFAWLTLADRRPSALAPETAVNLADPALISRGAYLATVGDCAGCHTAQRGAAYAGGRSLPTPFGDVPAPNLTPDAATGLGAWSFADFWQAFHAGRGRDGRLLYPAFPYTSYTRVSREDALTLFAYLKSLPPVRHATPAPSVRFPYDLRPAIAAWRALYFRESTFQPDPKRSAAWNRGAYLVQGLGHCNECHEARDTFGGLPKGQVLGGGTIPVQDWYAPDLSLAAHGGLSGWRTQDVVALLKTGQSPRGAAFGPMSEVVRLSTQHASDADLAAMATYLASLPARPAMPVRESALDQSVAMRRGQKLYEAQCADCHGKGGTGVPDVYPPLDGSVAVTEPTGINAIRMVLLGGFAPVTQAHPRPYSMPPYAQALSDQEVADVVTYIRHAWGNHAAPVDAKAVARYRQTPVD